MNEFEAHESSYDHQHKKAGALVFSESETGSIATRS